MLKNITAGFVFEMSAAMLAGPKNAVAGYASRAVGAVDLLDRLLNHDMTTGAKSADEFVTALREVTARSASARIHADGKHVSSTVMALVHQSKSEVLRLLGGVVA